MRILNLLKLIVERALELITKLLSVKGLFVGVTLLLVFRSDLDPIYGFIALLAFVGSREAFKIINILKQVKGQAEEKKNE